MRKIELLFLLLLVCLSSNAANKDSLIIRFFSWQMESPHNITCLNFENEVPYKEYIITSPVVIDSMSDQLQKELSSQDLRCLLAGFGVGLSWASAIVNFEKIYCSKDVVDIELAGYQVITTLVDLMIEAVRYPEKAYSQLLINRVSSQYHIQAPTLYEKIQAVLDYISGMTDVYALDLYRKINGNSLPAL